jgi:hypothetical protein
MLKGKAVTIWQVSALSYDDKNNNTYSVKLTSVKDFQLKIDCKYKMGFNIKNAYQIEEAELVGNDIIEFKKTNVKFRADIDN